MKNVRKNRLSRQLLTATLLLGGTFNLVSPVLAQTAPPTAPTYTSAGTSIKNRANATYEDPNAPAGTPGSSGNPINATSNEVTLTVAEVAGINVTGTAAEDTTPGTPVVAGDVINYDYTVTNVGNDPTRFFITGRPSVVGPVLVSATVVRADLDGDGVYETVINPTTGLTTNSIPAGGRVKVRVIVTVDANANAGETITVRLGNTTPNDNTGSQNQPDNADSATTTEQAQDVRTLDNDLTSGVVANEVNGTPTNGEREASYFMTKAVGANPQAFASVFKTSSDYTDSNTPNTLNDDLLTYNLSFKVDATAPSSSSGYIPANLVGTTITVNGNSTTQILISDAIPTGTVLNGTPTAPTGWQIIYTTDPTTGTGAKTAIQASWTTNPPNLSSVTRVGFINPGPITAGTPATTGFKFQVKTSGLTTSTSVSNIAQLFGLSANGGTKLVYDESGDQNPSNFNDNGTPGSNVPTSGLANPATDGTDPNNNNTGTGEGGEANVFTISAAGDISNGPKDKPDAAGPKDTNDDFTNKSTNVPAGTAPGSKIDPAELTFTNTLRNSDDTPISNVYLVPNASAIPSGSSLPKDTTVKITYNGTTASYTYDGTKFNLNAGSTAIKINSIAATTSVNYTVAVDLPANTELSTDTGKGYPVPIQAFIDSTANGTLDSGESNNITIDQLYTGFLKLTKQARILDSQGQVIAGYGSNPFTTPSTTDLQQVQPGNRIEYIIKYTNISTPAPQTGVGGSITLSATNVNIIEDGTQDPNNWAKDQDQTGTPGFGTIDTSHVMNSASDSLGNINYTPSEQSGTTAATDVTKYVDTLKAPLDPGASGTFTFQRKIN